MKAVVELCGGLGNQLFCYAFGFSQAKKYNAELWIDTSLHDSGLCRRLEILDLNIQYDKKISIQYSRNMFLRKLGYNWVRKKQKTGWSTKTYKVEEAFLPYAEIPLISDTYYRGYWQNYRFFDPYRDEIIKMIRPRYNVEHEYQDYRDKLLSTNSVAVHVRRGDYLKNGWDLSTDYYVAARNRIREWNRDIDVYIFSDDVEYCRNFFREIFPDAVYPEYKTRNAAIDDLMLMASCQYMIIANSTYSWWAAYMNSRKDSMIVCPIYREWNRNFYPNHWIGLEV